MQLNGKKVTTAAGELTLSTAKVIGAGKDRRRQPNQEVVFNRLGLGESLLHRLINPSIAYFLIVVGLALIVFEFYTASIGLAGLVGALCLIGAFVGFSHLPVHWWALALLFFSLFGFAVDVQAGGLGDLDDHRAPSASSPARGSSTAARRSCDRRGGSSWS